MTDATTSALADGYTDIPTGRIAAIATTLEMRSPPAPRSLLPLQEGLQIRRVERPDLDWYRALFRRIGEPWLWHSRLRLSEAALGAILTDDNVMVWALSAVDPGGELVADEGLLELDFRKARQCELAFFGLTTSRTGAGLGRHLMAHAIGEAWRRPIERFWVHTCTLDHPTALGFYIRSGFLPVKRQLEIAMDPRLDGTLSRDAAPEVPILR
jgi:GNAT superfamily N-acetyltransferase